MPSFTSWTCSDSRILGCFVDVVLSLFGSFSHALNLTAAIAEFQRVLRPGGRFLVMVYSRFSLRNILHACLKFHRDFLRKFTPTNPPCEWSAFYMLLLQSEVRA